MLIIIATAEPFGGYHLEPLLGELVSEVKHNFVYLTPNINEIQGNGLKQIEVTSDLAVLKKADKVIVTGGLYSNWTRCIAELSILYGKHLIYTELAYLSDGTSDTLELPTPHEFIAMSSFSKKIIAKAFGVEDYKIIVAGSPQLDLCHDTHKKHSKKLLEESNFLIVSSVGLHMYQRSLLLEAALLLKAAGAQVSVRAHPREDVSFWVENGIALSNRGNSVYDLLAQTDYAIASTGTFNSMLYFSGIPTVSFLNANHSGSPQAYMELNKVISNPNEVLSDAIWEQARILIENKKELADFLFGPKGGSSNRIVNAWSS